VSASRAGDRGIGPEPMRQQLAEELLRIGELPAAYDAERAMLGSIMLRPGVAGRVLPLLREHHFQNPAYREVFVALQQLHDRGSPLDAVTVLAELRRRGRVRFGPQNAGVVLHDCCEAAFTPGAGVSYAAILTEYATRRRLVEAGVRLVQLAQDGHGGLPDFMARVEAEYEALAAEASRHQRAELLENRGKAFSAPSERIEALERVQSPSGVEMER
jgi:replicative DNA helicase